MNKRLLFAVFSLVFISQVSVPKESSIAQAKNKAKAVNPSQSAPLRNGLRKAEFAVQDAVCVVCLREIQSTLRRSKGVLKAEPSLKFAYGFVVFYDQRKTTVEAILAPIRKKYTLFDVTDESTKTTK